MPLRNMPHKKLIDMHWQYYNGAEVISRSHTITYVITPLMILQLNNM